MVIRKPIAFQDIDKRTNMILDKCNKEMNDKFDAKPLKVNISVDADIKNSQTNFQTMINKFRNIY